MSVINQDNPFSTFDNFWWEEDMFDNRDSIPMVDASKNILDKVNEISDNILRNLRPVNNRTEQELADNQNIPIDDRTQQELEDDDYLSLESDVEEIDTTSAWDKKKKTTINKPGPVLKFSTDYNRKVKVANKIKNKYRKKIIGQKNKSNKISAEWLKTAGYLDTKDQDKINYIFVPPKKETTNKIPDDAVPFIRTEIDSTNFKKENLTSKIRKDKTKKPYFYKEKTQEAPKDSETTETIKILEDIANLEPGKNAQLAAKKISEKYKKMREALAKKWKYKIPGEIVKIKEVETQQGKVKVPVSVEKTDKKVIEKYNKIRHENKFKKIVDANGKRKKTEKIDVINEIKNSSTKKNAQVTAKKIVQKYKSMNKSKRTYLVSDIESDIESDDDPQISGQSIVEAANKVLDFDTLKKEQEKNLKDFTEKKKAL